MPNRPKTYLGDGCYAEMVNRMIKLTASDGCNDTNTIYLEQPVWNALKGFAQEVGMEPQDAKADS